MEREQLHKKKRVLIFNPQKQFIGIFSSQMDAAKILGLKTPSIRAACDGDAISASKLYFRWLDPEVEINVEEDLRNMTLREYDALCGVKRTVYKDSKMNRRKWKYNMTASTEKIKKSIIRKRKSKDESLSNQQFQA